MWAVARFLWNATRGSRLRPWRSEFLKWRIETYSGMKADTMTGRDVMAFVWQQRWMLARFLRWAAAMDADARRVHSR